MIVKILTLTRIKGAKTKGVGRGEERRRGLTLTRIIFCHHKNFRERIQNGQDRVPPLFYPS
jgi:hypothetical protein